MNKTFVVLGIILLSAGVIIASASTMSTETSETSTVATASNSWEISGQYVKDEKLLFSFTPPDLDELTFPEPTLKLRVEVTGPQESKTVFELEFKRGFGGQTVLYNLTVISNEDGLTVSENPLDVSGIVPYAGNYLANITTRRFWGPPANLVLDVEVVHKEYPYLFVLPMGIPLAVVGGSLLFLSIRSSKHKLRSRIKKS